MPTASRFFGITFVVKKLVIDFIGKKWLRRSGSKPTASVSYLVTLGHKGLYSVILSMALLWHYRRKFGIILGSGFKKA